jgi:hypothetical protein
MPILGTVSSGYFSPPIPDAPTIGTATAGVEDASVTFTAVDPDGFPITSYTVTSSPGGITATGASSPIVVTGLTTGTSYTFTVTATNAAGTSSASSASGSAVPIANFAWAVRSNLPAARAWQAIASNGSRLVAVADSTNKGAYSDNKGSTWTEMTLPGSCAWSNVAWNGTIWLAITYNSDNGNMTATSTDGITWTQRTRPNVNATKALATKSGRFAAIGNSQGAGWYTNDGVTFTGPVGVSVPGPRPFYGMTASSTRFVCVAYSGSSQIVWSTDGATWNFSSGLPSGDRYDVAWNGTVFCSPMYNSTTAITSPDGETWTSRTIPTGYWGVIEWNGSVFVALTWSNSAKAITSPDGITWTNRTIPGFVSEAVSAIGSTFVAAGAGTSADVYRSKST